MREHAAVVRLLVVALAICAVGPARALDETSQARSPAIAREYKGKLDPIGPFELRDLEGRSASDRDFRGKVLIVVQWAAWCGPCISEFPEVQKLYDTLRNDPSIRLTSIDLDEDPSKISEFLKELRTEYSFPVLFGWPRFKIKSLPCTWIVDRDGYIREVVRGSGPGWLQQVRTIAETVKGRPPVETLPAETREAQRQQNMRDGEQTR